MKSFDEVIAVRDQLEKKLIGHPAVTVIEIGASNTEAKPGDDEEYIIRIFVNDPRISYTELGITGKYRGIPVTVQYRKITLQQ